MKEKELKIISHLRTDSRASLSSISNDIKMPISTIYDKINKFHNLNLIKRYTTLIDYSKLGFHHHSKLILTTNKQERQDLLDFLRDNKSINSIQITNCGNELIIETIHKNVGWYMDFKYQLLECFNLTDLKEYQVTNEIVKEAFFIHGDY